MFTLFFIFWLLCSVAHAGLWMGYFQNKFYSIAEESYTEDLLLGWCLGLVGGPIVLVVGFFQAEEFKYGWLNPFRLSYKKP